MERPIVPKSIDRRQKTPCCGSLRARYAAVTMPFGMGVGELVLILVIVTVVFGATKLPQLGDGLGRAIKNFKRSIGSLNEIEVTPRVPSASEKKPDPAGAGSATTAGSGAAAASQDHPAK
jgi:sec-independent protein translocase protein TatA